MADEIQGPQINVTGDLSELQSALGDAVTAANEGASTIASSFQSISDASGLAGRDLEIFQQLLEQDAQSGVALQQSLEDLAGSASTVGDAIASGAAAALQSLKDTADQVPPALDPIPPALDDVKSHAEETESALAGMAEGFLAVGEALAITEGLKEFVTEAIEVYGKTQQVAVTFQLLGSSAAEAQSQIEELQHMSVTLAVPLDALEASARRLAVSFQDVEGVDLTDVLTAAANAAALTGRSFDTITTALQRVEITGAVTSRQLVSLGLTMQQLADTMGVSVDQATALLKKGGQDATTDLQVVLATIQRVAGDAAQAQAQTVLGQFTILKNQTEILFDDIGQLIAPTVMVIVSGLSTMVEWATEAVNEFEQLPPVIQDAGLAAAALAIAIPAAAIALGTLGLSIAGISRLIPAIEEGLGAIGIEATGMGAAIGAVALPVAAVFGGIAAWIATINLEGLTSDFENLANVVTAAKPGMVAVFDDVTAAAKTLAEEIPFVSGAMTELSNYFTGTNWIKNFIDAATPAFQLLDIAMKEVTIEATLAAVAFLTLTGHTQQAVQMLETLNGQTSTYTDEVEGATDETNTYTESVTATVGAHIQLASAITSTNTNLSLAKTALDAAKQAYNDGTGSLQAVEQAQLAYNASLKATPAVAVVAKNSIADIAGALATANDAVVNAQKSVDQLNQDLANGITQLGGFDIALELLPDAMDRLTKATLAYQTAINGGKDSVTAFVNTVTGEIGKLGTLVDTWTKLNAVAETTPAAAIAADNAFKQMQTAATALGITLTNTGGVIQASVTDPTKASADAIQGLINKFPQLNTAIADANAVMVNGITVSAGAQAGFIKFTDAVEGIKVPYTAFTGAVSDGTTKIGDMTISTNASVVALDAEGNAAAGATPKIQANTAATAAADKAAQALTQHQKDLNDAWVQGDLVVQKYNSDVAHVVGTLNDATTATNKYDSAYQTLNSTMTAVLGFGTNVVGAYQTIDGQIQAIAEHAEGSAAAVQNLNNALIAAAAADAAWEQAGASGLSGMKTSLASVLSADIAIASDPGVGGGLVTGGQIDQMAQALADATNEVVTTLDGTFEPAAMRAAQYLAGLQAQANATGKTLLDTFGGVETVVTPQLNAFQQVTQANTASTTANTTATTVNTTATTIALTAAQNSFLQAAGAGDDVVTSFADLPTAIQDYLAGVQGTLVAYDDTTGALQYTTAAVNGLATTVNAAVAPHELNTAAVVSSTTAIASLATATSSTVAAMGNLGAQTAAVATTTASVATGMLAATAAASQVVTTFDAISNALNVNAPGAGTSTGVNGGAGNLGLLGGYGPGSYGYETTTPGENQYPSTSGSVTLNVNVTGNSVTSQALVQQLADKVGSAIITSLRTSAGLKLG